MPVASELHTAPIRATIVLLSRRISERFPGSGLSQVAATLIEVADENQAVIRRLRRPIWWLRGLAVVAILAVAGITVWAIVEVIRRVNIGGVGGLSDLLQGVDAAFNELILLGLALLFLGTLEVRFKRRTALVMLHRLRSIAHVVDMHQLTKDPEYVLHQVTTTASSPVRNLTHDQLGRYLDYCSELLSLVSKLAALHAQNLQDSVVLDAVRDVENLSTGLSRKIWQKITILDVTRRAREGIRG